MTKKQAKIYKALMVEDWVHQKVVVAAKKAKMTISDYLDKKIK